MALSVAPCAGLTAALALLVAAPAQAQAREIGRYVQGELVVSLLDSQEDCPKGALRSLWVEPRLTVTGCWVELEGRVFIAWSDGDRHIVQRSLFNAAQGL